ncbi:small cysteine-rich secretory protein SCR99 [Phytophthora cinnamomi]|uniref:small cysteine-rich secretory protein SCR99 n=1 Tax=Phytophthora cinnamomi TaxID=4785 RepID=UPI00355A7C9A|nr:small cysteine-rich secretory protein SCR99 [Phytophthora cinnamomi]KAG6608910.1 small cysteine-rich secretory protein SCR99 [Phytophthora cinnamomi]
MKVWLVLVALSALLLPTHGALRQCAGIEDDNSGATDNESYEPSGFLTADFTQKACKASGGSIDPNLKGNQKCCNVPDAQQRAFSDSCKGQKAGGNFLNYRPFAQPC